MRSEGAAVREVAKHRAWWFGLLGLLLAGCGVGQTAATAGDLPSVPGVSAGDAGVAVRNAYVEFSPDGYPLTGDAPIHLSIINNTTQEVRLTEATSAAAGAVTVQAVLRRGPATDTDAEPGAADAAPVELALAPGELVTATLQAGGLDTPLDMLVTLPVTLSFDNGAVLGLELPMAPPREPLPPGDPREDVGH